MRWPKTFKREKRQLSLIADHAQSKPTLSLKQSPNQTGNLLEINSVSGISGDLLYVTSTGAVGIKSGLYDGSGLTSLAINGSYITIGDPLGGQTFSNGIGIKFFDTGTAHASMRFTSSSSLMELGTSSSVSALTLDGTGIAFDLGNKRLGINVNSGINSALTFAAATNAAGGILFGTDTNLYRSASDTLQTDDSLIVSSTLTTTRNIVSGATISSGGGNPILDLSQTWNTTGTPTLISGVVTNTASNAASKLIDLKVGSTSMFNVNVGGDMNIGGVFNSNGNGAIFQWSGSTVMRVLNTGAYTDSQNTSFFQLGLNYGMFTAAFGGAMTRFSVASATNIFSDQAYNAIIPPIAFLQLDRTSTVTSGSTIALAITPIYNQSSGSAINTDLLINRTETHVGSGTQLLIDAQVGTVSKFSVNNIGTVSLSLVSLSTTSTDGLILANTTASTVGTTVQMSPRLRLSGSAWKSASTAASQAQDWVIENLPATGTSATTSTLRFGSNNAGGGYNYRMSLTDVGALTISAGITATTGTYSSTISTTAVTDGSQTALNVTSRLLVDSSGGTAATFASQGVQVSKSVSSGVVSLTDATTISSGQSLVLKNGNHFRLLTTDAVGSSRTIGDPGTGYDGQKITFEIIQSSSGSKGVTFSTTYFAFGTDITTVTPSTAANKRDLIGCIYSTSLSKWMVVSVVRGF